MTDLDDRTRRRGAAVRRQSAGRYTVNGHRQTGAVLTLEAVAADVIRWCQAVSVDE